jgi:GT2 family glycosyltransferase
MDSAIQNTSQSVLAVIVLYQRGVNEIVGLKSLIQLTGQKKEIFVIKSILIYDNSMQRQNKIEFCFINNVLYIHNPENGGTVAAYSCAVDIAIKNQIEWILFLDQDTGIEENMLAELSEFYLDRRSVEFGALVPVVLHDKKQISPAVINKYGCLRPLCLKEKCRGNDVLTAVASGALIRTAFLKEILPFPSELWLDYVDHWMFLQMYRKGYSVGIYRAKIQHDLSVMNISKLTVKRVLSILDGEIFLCSEIGCLAVVFFPIRLLLRILRYGIWNRKLVIPILGWSCRRVLEFRS